ncbi:hypothetical protein B0H14DRAFT_2383717, partial [Mycena olivaceomarginata]
STRCYRWHIDAVLYNLSLPRVMTLYALCIPRRLPQVCRYDDGMGDTLSVPLGTTTFVMGKTVWGVELKNVAMRARIMYAPHPYVWMGPAHAKSTGLGLECNGIKVELGALPPWEAQRKTLPVLWKNPVTGELAFQVHLAACEAALYPDGAHLTDLKEVRDLLYTNTLTT